MAPAFLIYIAYLMLLTKTRAQIVSGELPPLPGLWAVHLIFLSLALILLFGPDLIRRMKYRSYLRAQA